MRATQRRSLLLLFAAIALFAAPAAFASIPRSTLLDPQPFDRFEFRETESGHNKVASIDNAELLARALDRAIPASAPVTLLAGGAALSTCVRQAEVRRRKPLARHL